MTEIERLQENANQINSDFQAVKSAIVESGVEIPEGTRTLEYGAKVREVYAKGKQAQVDAFWDTYQQNGERADYSRAFGGNGWNPDNFKPKYDMICTRCDGMFNYVRKLKIDLVECLNNLGVVLDTSKSVMLTGMFEWSPILRVGVIDLSSATAAGTIFNSASNLHTIDELVFPTDRDLGVPSAFLGCTALANIKISGEIRYTIDFKDCPLTRASIESIMTHLSESKTGLTVSFKKTAVDTAFETAEGAADGSNSAEWETLKATRTDWIISLIDA